MTLKYLFAKLLVYIQIPAIKSSKLHKTSKLDKKVASMEFQLASILILGEIITLLIPILAISVH